MSDTALKQINWLNEIKCVKVITNFRITTSNIVSGVKISEIVIKKYCNIHLKVTDASSSDLQL